MRFKSVFCLFLVLLSCEADQKVGSAPAVFVSPAPRNSAFVEEMKYLQMTGMLTSENREIIEKELSRVEATLGVPKALLWCVLFQESRFDPFKNALNRSPAKGLGQFTASALDEINDETNYFDPRTQDIFESELKAKVFPIQFVLKSKKKVQRALASKKRNWPEQPVQSYYNPATAIYTSAAYINNRYYELKSILDHQNLRYDPQVLWLYAAAAYNKGERSVLALLTSEYMKKGDDGIYQLLNNAKETYHFLTQPKNVEPPLQEIWQKKVLKRYMDEFLRNMEVVISCSVTGLRL